jgi:hemolysin activation/secretion protein
MARMQNLIVTKGFVTTRLTAGPQDLTSGRLALTVVPGRVREIRLVEDSDKWIFLTPNIPVRPGDVLNIRDVEQGLENLKRSPKTQVGIQIQPGEKAGESDLAVTLKQGLPIRASLGVDDSGSSHTGKIQGTATLSIDNPTGLSDLFYASFSHNLERNQDYGTRAYSFYYSVPWGYNQLSISSTYFTYYQTVAGYATNYEYSGSNRTSSLELSRVIHRGPCGVHEQLR